MKVLFLPIPTMVHPWLDDIICAFDGKQTVEFYDPAEPLKPQFEGVGVVVDQGGIVGTHEMIDAAAAAGVKLYQILGTGLDGADVPYLLHSGMLLANTPGQFSAIALAEQALCFMLQLVKHPAICRSNIRHGIRCEPLNEELCGKTLGLIGFGASARELATRAAAMGMRILALDAVACPQSILDERHATFLGDLGQLDRLLAESDFVSLHLPLTAQTRHLIGRRELKLMKSSSYLINVARGEIVDEVALTEALAGQWISGAGLDVFAEEPVNPEHPLLKFENVIASPHVAGVTWGTSRRRAAAVAENIDRVAQGLAPLHQISADD